MNSNSEKNLKIKESDVSIRAPKQQRSIAYAMKTVLAGISLYTMNFHRAMQKIMRKITKDMENIEERRMKFNYMSVTSILYI